MLFLERVKDIVLSSLYFDCISQSFSMCILDDCDNTKSKARKKSQKLPSAIAVEKEEQNWEENQTFATSDIDQSLTETESSSIDNRLREIESDGENSDDQVNSLQETDSEDQPRVELDNNSNKSDTDQSSWEQESVVDDDELLQRCLRSKITKLHQDNRLHDDFKENLFEYTRNDRESESTGSDVDDGLDVEEEEVLPAEIVEFYAKEIDQTAWKEGWYLHKILGTYCQTVFNPFQNNKF